MVTGTTPERYRRACRPTDARAHGEPRPTQQEGAEQQREQGPEGDREMIRLNMHPAPNPRLTLPTSNINPSRCRSGGTPRTPC